MFNQRIGKQNNLKAITIQYELDKPNSTKEVTISSAQEMQALIDAAVAHDVKNLKRATENVPSSWVHSLKQKIYNAYLRMTDDFRDSIYKQKKSQREKNLEEEQSQREKIPKRKNLNLHKKI